MGSIGGLLRYGSEPSGSVKDGEFVTRMSEYQLLMNGFVVCVT
jgi:hypothetical protein